MPSGSFFVGHTLDSTSTINLYYLTPVLYFSLSIKLRNFSNHFTLHNIEKYGDQIQNLLIYINHILTLTAEDFDKNKRYDFSFYRL